MAVSISPWPTDPAALIAARDCLRTGLGISAAQLPDDRADILGAAASALVESFGPCAPPAIKTLAVIRSAGWLKNATSSDIVPTGVVGLEFSWRPTIGRNALRQSGAMGILSPLNVPYSGTI